MFSRNKKKLQKRHIIPRHSVVALIAIMIVASFGAYSVFFADAATLQSSHKLQSARGCWLAGRTWNADSRSCDRECRFDTGKQITIKSSSGAQQMYCSGSIAPWSQISEKACVNNLHRQFVSTIGCARRVDQAATSNAWECQQDYPNYVANGSKDYCKAGTVTKATKYKNIKVVHGNIYFGLKDKQFHQDLDKIMKPKPDVITLNEASYRSAKDLDRKGYKSYGASKDAYKQEARVLWKTDTWQVKSPANKNSGRKTLSQSSVKGGNRYANWVTLVNKKDPSKVFTIISVHTLQGPLDNDVRTRLLVDSMDNLTTLINNRSKAGAVIIGGDFNIDWYEYSKNKNPGLPRIALKTKSKAVSTYDVLGKPKGWRTGKPAGTIDYIFFTRQPSLDLVRQKLIYSINSDHNYVQAEFKLY